MDIVHTGLFDLITCFFRWWWERKICFERWGGGEGIKGVMGREGLWFNG
jgi:hypothetical protein